VPHPVREAIEIRFSRGEYGDHDGKINRLDVGNDLYMALFPRECRLTVDVGQLPQRDQDCIHDFALWLAREGRHVTALTDEKPLTAVTLLRLAREHAQTNGG